MKAVIVDNEQCTQGRLRGMLSELNTGITLVGVADGLETGLNLVRQTRPEVIFLDIEMPNNKGYHFLEHLPYKNSRVIFCAAHYQYALEALRHVASDYLLKPIKSLELQEAINRARMSLKNTAIANPRNTHRDELYTSDNRLVVSDKNNIYLIDLPDLLYCKGEGNYTTFHLRDGTSVVISKHLKTYEKQLLRGRFFRVHTSFIVNLRDVKRIVKGTADMLVMTNGDEVPMATRRKTDVIKALIA